MEEVQFIDVSDLMLRFPSSKNPICSFKLEIDACLMEECLIECGGTKKLRTNVGICNIPENYYVEFVGLKTSAGVWTKEGILKNDSFGYLFVYVHNSSLEN